MAVSVAEYLGNPDYKHFEYVSGEVVERAMGTSKHSRLQGKFFALLDAFADCKGPYFGTALHCRMTVEGEEMYRLPDVAMVEQAAFNEDRLIGGPTLAIEIRSPEERIKDILTQTEEYFANGTKLVWVVDPEAKNVMVLMNDRVPWIVEVGEELTGAPIWLDLKVNLEVAFRGI